MLMRMDGIVLSDALKAQSEADLKTAK